MRSMMLLVVLNGLVGCGSETPAPEAKVAKALPSAEKAPPVQNFSLDKTAQLQLMEIELAQWSSLVMIALAILLLTDL